VVKLSADGSSIIFSTFIGGRSDDQGYRITLDSSGIIYVVGRTYSDNFPVYTSTHSTPGSYDHIFNGVDGIICKLSSDGSTLIASTYLGGKWRDSVEDIVLNQSENAVYVTGITDSPDFPYTLGAYSPGLNGRYDAFISKLSGDLSRMHYSTLVGGRYDDGAYGITRDHDGNVYITGYTLSDNFPTTSTAYDKIHGDGGTAEYDAFVTKLNADGSDLIFSTLLGGTREDVGKRIALDNNGNIWIAGETLAFDFPHTPDAYDKNFEDAVHFDWEDIFLSKLSPGGNTLLYSSFFGGIGSDWLGDIVLDDEGSLYITGFTDSLDFHTSPDGFDTTYNGRGGGGTIDIDAFVSIFSPDGTMLNYSTFLGGTNNDFAYGITLDLQGNVVVVGRTHSNDFPTTSRAYRRYLETYYDIFITKLNPKADDYTIPAILSIELIILTGLISAVLLYFLRE